MCVCVDIVRVYFSCLYNVPKESIKWIVRWAHTRTHSCTVAQIYTQFSGSGITITIHKQIHTHTNTNIPDEIPTEHINNTIVCSLASPCQAYNTYTYITYIDIIHRKSISISGWHIYSALEAQHSCCRIKLLLLAGLAQQMHHHNCTVHGCALIANGLQRGLCGAVL